MKRFLTTLPAYLLGTAAAIAATSVSDIDRNNDDFASYEELSAVYDGLTRNEFETIDTNSDNRVSPNEIYAPDAQRIVSRYEGTELPHFVIDLNGDGFSEYDEITTVFTDLSENDFRLMDMNDDNRLSQFELYETEAQDILNRFRSMEEVATVKKADTNRDGFLNQTELTAMYPGLTDEDFDQIDDNNDNRVSFNEIYVSDAQNILARYES